MQTDKKAWIILLFLALVWGSSFILIKKSMFPADGVQVLDPAAPRSGRVDITLRDGRTVSHFTRHPPGTKENPLDTNGVNEKARGLIDPVLGRDRATAISEMVSRL